MVNMKKHIIKVIALFIVAVSYFCYSDTANALDESCVVVVSTVACDGENVLLKGETSNPIKTPSSEVETVYVKLRDGETLFYDDNCAVRLRITPDAEVIKDGGFSGVVSTTLTDENNSTSKTASGTITIRCEESTGQLVKKSTLNNSETVLLQVTIEYTDTTKKAVNEIGYIELGRVSNIEAVLMRIIDWEQIQNNVDFKAQYEGISNSLGQQQNDIKGITTVNEAVSNLTIQLDDAKKLDVIKLIAIGVVVLMLLGLLILLHVRTKTKKTEPIVKNESNEKHNQSIREILDVAIGIANQYPEINQHLLTLDGHIIEVSNKINGASVFKPKEDATKDFLDLVNSSTSITAPDQWIEKLKKYQPELLKYDEIQQWFSRGGTFGEPPFAACSVRSYEGIHFFLIPSCYDTMLASIDIQVAYDVILPVNGERPRSYRVDRAAMLEIFGAYYRVVSRGQIVLIP